MRDYLRYTFRITFVVVAALLVIALIPPFSVLGVNFRRANILSDFLAFTDKAKARIAELTTSDLEFLKEAEELDLGGIIPEAEAEPVTQSWELDETEVDSIPKAAQGVRGQSFEDYTPVEGVSVADFVRTMESESERRVVRIAFFGDSFIEGDIITGDVREQLQDMYGGSGVGFVPMGTPQAISRPSVKHTFGGWKNYSLVYKKSVPSPYRDMFAVTGALSVPEAGWAWSEYRGAGFRKHLGSWSRARVLFRDEGGAAVDIAVNDSITRRFTPAPGTEVQQISLTGGGMRSLRVAVEAPNSGFVGYGVVLEGTSGVDVDNFALRSNSGIAFFGTNKDVNVQMGRLLGCDMVVLQWGLNAMAAGATEFGAYGAQLRRVINYMKACFPNSAIVVMGVGDRAGQVEGTLDTQPGVEAMVREQRAAARACGVAFWDTFAAMGGRGSMVRYVENGWAAKDYTHLGHAGGRQIAGQFVKSLAASSGGQAQVSTASAPRSETLDMTHATPTEQQPQQREGVDTVHAAVPEPVVERSALENLEAAVDSTR